MCVILFFFYRKQFRLVLKIGLLGMYGAFLKQTLATLTREESF